MQFQRQMMRHRVARRFARVPGQHGDGHNPMFYPIAINPNFWGTPWAKVKDNWWMSFFAGVVGLPASFYYYWEYYGWYKTRIGVLGKRAFWVQRKFKFNDLDDPDYEIKYEKMIEERARGDHIVTWGGTNMIASYLWEPGDPDPDQRRRDVPDHHAH